jgi:electron transfer flavoprotein beta subunit
MPGAVFAALRKRTQLGGAIAIEDDGGLRAQFSETAAQILAELLGYGQATFANVITLEAGKATVVREADGGLETVSTTLPAVITTDLRLNEPRYASLPGIMKAKKKPLDEVDIGSLGVDIAAKVKTIAFEEPAAKKAGQKVADVATLVTKLKTEAKAI